MRTVVVVDEVLWVAEWYRPGVTVGAAIATVAALREICRSRPAVDHVSFVDGTWFPEDEVLAARFRGDRDAVAAVCERADLRFDRISCAVLVDRSATHPA